MVVTTSPYTLYSPVALYCISLLLHCPCHPCFLHKLQVQTQLSCPSLQPKTQHVLQALQLELLKPMQVTQLVPAGVVVAWVAAINLHNHCHSYSLQHVVTPLIIFIVGFVYIFISIFYCWQISFLLICCHLCWQQKCEQLITYIHVKFQWFCWYLQLFLAYILVHQATLLLVCMPFFFTN